MVEQGDDQLMHFKWKDRSSGNIEDDLIIFPDDAEFKKSFPMYNWTSFYS